jgi:exopolysaccharide production protein ExoZ
MATATVHGAYSENVFFPFPPTMVYFYYQPHEDLELIANIQLLRAIAAILVFFHHSLPTYKAMAGASELFTALATWGWFGVDIFFVISGFVICSSTLSKGRVRNDAKTYLKKRFARIYLGYWPFLIVAVVMYSIYEPKRLEGTDLVLSALLVSTDFTDLVLDVTWTLSHELYFYLLFLAVFFVSDRGATMLIFFASFFCTLINISNDKLPDSISFVLSPYLLEFLAGTLIYIYRTSIQSTAGAIGSALLIVGGMFLGITYGANEGIVRVATFGAASAGLVGLATNLEYREIFVAPSFLKSIGDSSYTLYLCHLILIYLFYYWGARSYLGAVETLWIKELGFVLFITVTIAFSWAYYICIERPIYRLAALSNWTTKN